MGCLLCGITSNEAAQFEEHRVANIFAPHSVPAEKILEAGYLVSFVCLGIFIFVAGFLVYTLIRYRWRPGDDASEPPQIYGGAPIELAWTVIPVLIVAVLALVTARTIGEIQNAEMPEDALTIRLIGHQWWWEVQYPEYGFITANEIHVPVSSREDRRPTHIILESADVIHSFWVPQLAGKTDLVPNRVNHTWIEPLRTGLYLGNCAEYCGTQHANMLLRVYVHEEEDFQKWVAGQQRPAVDAPQVAAGRQRFMETSCINCHTIAGTPAEGTFGPDLTHLASRDTIGAGVVPLTPQTLHDWIANPQAIKPGAHMPDMKLTPEEVNAITDYLLTLK